MGKTVEQTYEANPGQVWEETEFWIELSWQIDPDGSLGIRQHFESPYRPGEKITMDEYYGWMFENIVPGLPEAAAAEGLTPLAYMRRYGAFEVAAGRRRSTSGAWRRTKSTGHTDRREDGHRLPELLRRGTARTSCRRPRRCQRAGACRSG